VRQSLSLTVNERCVFKITGIGDGDQSFDPGSVVILGSDLRIMEPVLTPEITEVLNAAHSRPSLSVILPLEPRFSLKAEAAQSLKIAADKAHVELLKYYQDDECRPIVQKLQRLISEIRIPFMKKGLAIFISPEFERVFFLDTPVEEKVIVDESFEIRELLYNAKQTIPLLLVILSGKTCRVFRGNQYNLKEIRLQIRESVYAYVNDAPERVANFSDMTARKQIVVENFLHHIDRELDNLLNETPSAVLLFGPEKILGDFKKLSRHNDTIMAHIHGNYEEADINTLLKLTSVHLEPIKTARQQELMRALDDAAGRKLIAMGINEVWNSASDGKGRLLVIEKNYHFTYQLPFEQTGESDPLNPHMRDITDAAIERVLRYGGDVEFVDDGLLENFEHIALVRYYPL